jgi:hypothetical protein
VPPAFTSGNVIISEIKLIIININKYARAELVTDYEVVYGHDIWVLKTKVKELLAAGWQPFNELQIATPVQDNVINPFYAQVMVKTKD